VILLENIEKTYKMGDIKVDVLRGLNLKIETGEMVAIMGPSGCGKSTLMNIMGCLDYPSLGRYYLDEVEVNKLSDSKLAEFRNKRIGFVFQSFNLLRRTTAQLNVELPMVYGNGQNKTKRAKDALERVGLINRAHHHTNQLSGGEQQRVAIARALVNNPSIILADEPTGNLDSVASLEIMNILEQLHQQDSITVVMVTHEYDIALHAQRIVTMRDGRIIRDESTAEMRKRNRMSDELNSKVGFQTERNHEYS
jgi:putative ABC transport system ATP-binding protein